MADTLANLADQLQVGMFISNGLNTYQVTHYNSFMDWSILLADHPCTIPVQGLIFEHIGGRDMEIWTIVEGPGGEQELPLPDGWWW